MSDTLNIQDILSMVKELDRDEQLALLERFVAIIRKNEVPKTNTRLSAISGIGSKIWKKVNIDEYINEERQW